MRFDELFDFTMEGIFCFVYMMCRVSCCLLFFNPLGDPGRGKLHSTLSFVYEPFWSNSLQNVAEDLMIDLTSPLHETSHTLDLLDFFDRTL